MRTFVSAGVFSICLMGPAGAWAQDIALSTNPAGITIGGAVPSWSTGFGSVNGLGLGTPGSGQTILTPSSGGVLYTTPYNIVISGVSNSNRAVVRAYASTNFVHSSILQVYSCVLSCTSASSFSAMSTSAAAQTDVVPSPGLKDPQTITSYFAVFVSNQNGASAFAGTDSATITFNVYRGSNSLQHTYTLTLNNPLENVQTAVRMVLAGAPGGAAIGGSSSFTLSYGSVNGLGIGPGSGLSAVAASGGQIYSTPYLLQPRFSSFASTTATLRAYVSTDFVHPSQLELRDSSSGSTFSPLSKSAVSQTVLSSTAASSANVTRYLGLFVSSTNGAGVFTGGDNATVTFTLVVP